MTPQPPFTLHLVTARARLRPDARTIARELAALEAQVDAAIEGGIDVVQLRERDLEAGVLADLARRLVARAALTPTRILVNERADVARAAGAGGVHLPSAGMPANRVRSLQPAWMVGRSIHSGDRPDDAAACDYLLFGTVFASESKPEGSAAAGTAALARAAAQFAQPVVAIGGVTPERAAACIEAGARGLAAIGAFLPSGAAREARGVRDAVGRFRAAIAAYVS